MGMEPIFFKVTDESKLEPAGDGLVNKQVKILIRSTAPSDNGWRVRGTVDYRSKLPIVHSNSKKGIPSNYWTDSQACDHCHTKRKRDKLVILEDIKTGELSRVGTSCLKAFMDTDIDIVQMVKMLDDLQDDIDKWRSAESDGSFGGKLMYDAKYFLALSLYAIRKKGWVSKKQEFEGQGISTANTVVDMIREKEKVPGINEYMDNAKKIIAWARSDKFEPESDFDRNMKAVGANDAIYPDQAGLLAYLPELHRRLTQAYKPKSDWLGKVGEKVTVTFTVENIQEKQGGDRFRGWTTWTLTGPDTNGNQVRLKTSSEKQISSLKPQINTRLHVVATIIYLGEWRNTRYTIIGKRAKIEIAPPEGYLGPVGERLNNLSVLIEKRLPSFEGFVASLYGRTKGGDYVGFGVTDKMEDILGAVNVGTTCILGKPTVADLVTYEGKLTTWLHVTDYKESARSVTPIENNEPAPADKKRQERKLPSSTAVKNFLDRKRLAAFLPDEVGAAKPAITWKKLSMTAVKIALRNDPWRWDSSSPAYETHQASFWDNAASVEERRHTGIKGPDGKSYEAVYYRGGDYRWASETFAFDALNAAVAWLNEHMLEAWTAWDNDSKRN